MFKENPQKPRRLTLCTMFDQSGRQAVPSGPVLFPITGVLDGPVSPGSGRTGSEPNDTTTDRRGSPRVPTAPQQVEVHRWPSWP